MIKILLTLVLLIVGVGSQQSAANIFIEACQALLKPKVKVLEEEPIQAGPPTWIDAFNQEFQKQKSEFSKAQVKLWTEALEHLSEDLKGVELSQAKNAKPKAVHDQLRRVLEKLPQIYEAWLKLKDGDKRSQYMRASYQAVWAAVTVHSHEIMDGPADLDYERYFKIMRTIEEFDSENPRFSFYKIRRAVEGRFHMRDFVQCKGD